MKRTFFVMAALLISSFFYAEGMNITGDFSSETRISISNGDLLFNEENGNIKFENSSDGLYGMAQIDFRYYNNPLSQVCYSNTLNALELESLYSVEPIEISLDQAYFSYKNFIFDKLDLSAGKQRIAWGTADGLNPTDLLDANDTSDPFNIGRKFGTLAVNLNYALPADNGNFQFVYEPFSPVARLNTLFQNNIQNIIVSNIASGANLQQVNANETVWNGTAVTPDLNASNFTIGAKLSGNIEGFDLSISYVSRINDLPYIQSLNINQTSFLTVSQIVTNITLQSVNYTLAYYREQDIGFDFSKDLGFILLWGEAAITFPGEQDTSVANTSALVVSGIPTGMTVSTNFNQVAISNTAYVKYTIGFDKTFADNWYINFQYNHGFFSEVGNSGPDRLEDYLLLRLEKKLFNDKLKIGIDALYNVNDFYDAINSGNIPSYLETNSGVMLHFMVAYTPVDDITVETGIYYLFGSENCTIGQWNSLSCWYMKFDYSF
jgi:hypothetical protein